MNPLPMSRNGEPRFLVPFNAALLALIFSLLFLVVLLPPAWRPDANRILLTAIFLACLLANGWNKGWHLGAVLMLILAQWVFRRSGDHPLALTVGMLNTAFFIFVAARLVVRFARAREVSSLVLLGAINGYLLMGLIFSIMAAVISGLAPGSYFVSRDSTALAGSAGFHDYVYYAFITMATVGYGDIVPVGAAARAQAVLMAVAGPLYLAIVIAFLVGKFAGRRSEGVEGRANPPPGP